MSCQDVGEPNADIGGLGIVISFAFQAGLSLILSVWSLAHWKSALLLYPEAANTSNTLPIFGIPFFSYAWGRLTSATKPHCHDARAFQVISRGLGYCSETYHKLTRWMVRKIAPVPAAEELESGRLGMEKQVIDEVIETISAVQTFNAIGLALAALTQTESISLYHLRLVYDTVSFTGVSVCASLVNVVSLDKGIQWYRSIPLAAFFCLYVAFIGVFFKALTDWNDNRSGDCYHTYLVSASGSSHPAADIAYVAITSFYFLSSLALCLHCHFALESRFKFQSDDSSHSVSTVSSAGDKFARLQVQVNKVRGGIGLASLWGHQPHEIAPSIVKIALFQYPLHLYMTVALRASNESSLDGNAENQWGFGQIVALTLSAATLLECIRGVVKIMQLRRAKAEDLMDMEAANREVLGLRERSKSI